MTRRAPSLLIALAVAVALVAAAGPAAAADAPTAEVTARPASSPFGDAFTLEAVVRIPGGGEDVAVVLDTAPFAALAASSTSRRDDDGVTVVTVRQQVACLDFGCVPGTAPAVVATRPVRVRLGRRTVTVGGSTTRVTITGRVPRAVVDRDSGGYRGDRGVPARTFPLAPGTLVALLVAGAVVAALGAAALLWPDLRRRLSAGAEGADADPVARALRLLRESAARSGGDRRRAASLVARLLGARGDRARAAGATTLAWSRPEPAPADATGLADAVEREGAA